MKPVPEIGAFIFDFGRVISAQKPESLFRSYEQDLGLAPGSINRIMFESEAWQETLRGHKSEEEFWLAIGPALGLETRETLNHFRDRYRADERVNPEVRDLVRRLHGRYRLAVLSNAPPGLDRWLRDWEMLHLFQVVFCSGEEGVVKPAPEAYLRTLELLGVRPRETVFIDDTPENVEAARALGMDGVLFTDYPALAAELRSKIDPALTAP
jgi:putative hydrolase of the HAD superfamily